MDYMALSAAEWQQEYDKLSAEYESWKAKGLKLNMAPVSYTHLTLPTTSRV